MARDLSSFPSDGLSRSNPCPINRLFGQVSGSNRAEAQTFKILRQEIPSHEGFSLSERAHTADRIRRDDFQTLAYFKVF